MCFYMRHVRTRDFTVDEKNSEWYFGKLMISYIHSTKRTLVTNIEREKKISQREIISILTQII